MLEGLKRACERALAQQLAPEVVAQAYELAENRCACELALACVLYCLDNHAAMLAAPKAGVASYAGTLARMRGRLERAVADAIQEKCAREKE
ncbi:hypothetical protein H632_c4335p0 [Helicosporidium sp. ATCC 50920]|nr:hypothetical protein H632_c4335p0 [Helicosporidium sp. ATCC 50920]|eukprot:KDD71825.1 hypothetical protein H632_c4335p0 [Helicosporidium sp. ATCC 50920]